MEEKKTWCHKRDSEGNLYRVDYTDELDDFYHGGDGGGDGDGNGVGGGIATIIAIEVIFLVSIFGSLYLSSTEFLRIYLSIDQKLQWTMYNIQSFLIPPDNSGANIQISSSSGDGEYDFPPVTITHPTLIEGVTDYMKNYQKYGDSVLTAIGKIIIVTCYYSLTHYPRIIIIAIVVISIFLIWRYRKVKNRLQMKNEKIIENKEPNKAICFR